MVVLLCKHWSDRKIPGCLQTQNPSFHDSRTRYVDKHVTCPLTHICLHIWVQKSIFNRNTTATQTSLSCLAGQYYALTQAARHRWRSSKLGLLHCTTIGKQDKGKRPVPCQERSGRRVYGSNCMGLMQIVKWRHGQIKENVLNISGNGNNRHAVRLFVNPSCRIRMFGLFGLAGYVGKASESRCLSVKKHDKKGESLCNWLGMQCSWKWFVYPADNRRAQTELVTFC